LGHSSVRNPKLETDEFGQRYSLTYSLTLERGVETFRDHNGEPAGKCLDLLVEGLSLLGAEFSQALAEPLIEFGRHNFLTLGLILP
jgi:hypothetical protein